MLARAIAVRSELCGRLFARFTRLTRALAQSVAAELTTGGRPNKMASSSCATLVSGERCHSLIFISREYSATPFGNLIAEAAAFVSGQSSRAAAVSRSDLACPCVVPAVRASHSAASVKPCSRWDPLAAARATLGRRLVVAFQPHRYTRTQQLMEAFGPAMRDADEIVLTDIYPASEEPIAGVTIDALADAVRRGSGRPVHLARRLDDVIPEVLKLARPGDAVITLGAGSIGTLPAQLVDALKRREGKG